MISEDLATDILGYVATDCSSMVAISIIISIALHIVIAKHFFVEFSILISLLAILQFFASFWI